MAYKVIAVSEFFWLCIYGIADKIIWSLLSATNKMQRCTIFFIIVNALQVSGGETSRNM